MFWEYLSESRTIKWERTDRLTYVRHLLDEEAEGYWGEATRADSHSQRVAEMEETCPLSVPALVFFPSHPTLSLTGVPWAPLYTLIMYKGAQCQESPHVHMKVNLIISWTGPIWNTGVTMPKHVRETYGSLPQKSGAVTASWFRMDCPGLKNKKRKRNPSKWENKPVSKWIRADTSFCLFLTESKNFKSYWINHFFF